ncbi:MAG: hypothetical protein ACKVQA_15135 [Burkholderiales bacterium]
MKRLLVLLLILLPLQWSAAAVAGYCQHETGVAAKHTGHHNHKHDGSANEKTPQPSAQTHNDCGMCHLSCGGAVSLGSGRDVLPFRALMSARNIPHFLSAFTSRPERPNWWPLA